MAIRNLVDDVRTAMQEVEHVYIPICSAGWTTFEPLWWDYNRKHKVIDLSKDTCYFLWKLLKLVWGSLATGTVFTSN